MSEPNSREQFKSRFLPEPAERRKTATMIIASFQAFRWMSVFRYTPSVRSPDSTK